MAAAEDVYYITRDGSAVIGLNQLLAVPSQLTEVELRAIEGMCARSVVTMVCQRTALAMPALRGDGAIHRLSEHGLYYVGPDGSVWLLSRPDHRPDLDGPEMDFAVATVEAGKATLTRLRQELERL
jgi:hypothetical protein